MDYFESFNDALQYFYHSGNCDGYVDQGAKDYYWKCSDSERAALDEQYRIGLFDSIE